MFEVEFYEDKRGVQPVKEALIELRDKAQTSKDARIQYQKILAHIRALEAFGTRIGEPQVKHIDGNCVLWRTEFFSSTGGITPLFCCTISLKNPARHRPKKSKKPH